MTKPGRRARDAAPPFLPLAGVCALALQACGATKPPPPPPPPAPAQPSAAQKRITSQSYPVTLTSKRGGRTTRHGTAELTIRVQRDRVCWRITELRGVPHPLHISINRGASTSTSPVVISLGTNYHTTGCQGPVAPALLLQIERRPHNYYMAITDAVHPTGAIRGQLENRRR